MQEWPDTGGQQSDYFALVKGGGHGNYRNIVLAPASVQEMAELTALAFELADKYRNPAVVMADGFVGQMMEPLDLEYREIVAPPKPWAVRGSADTRKNLVTSIYLEPDDLEAHQRRMEAKYMRCQQAEARYELYETSDADVLLEAHKVRVERGDYSIAQEHLADAIEALVRQSRASLSDDRSPKDPYD